MTQARDELFLKLALRQGLFTKQEAIEFLGRYREEGARGEGIGQWLVIEGILSEEQASMIRGAIAHRAEGHVDTTRRRVPKRVRGGGTPQPKGQVHHPVRRHQSPRGKLVSPMQQSLFIGSLVIAVGLIVFLVYQFQKADPPPPVTAKETDASQVKGSGNSANATAGQGAASLSNASAPLTTPAWTQQEIDSMTQAIKKAITTARSHQSDGRPGRAIESIKKRLGELGERVPDAVQALADAELAELQQIVEEAYQEALTELQAAKASGDSEAVEFILTDIEDVCGAKYAKMARELK